MEQRKRRRRRRQLKLWVVLMPLVVSLILASGLLYFGLDWDTPTGWTQTDGVTRYWDESGSYLTGWQEIDGIRYYFQADGAMATGYLELEGRHFQFRDDGQLYTGYLERDGDTYYFGEDGAMVLGWQEIDGVFRYFDETGKAHTGWLELDGNSYYLSADTGRVTGWAEVEGKRRYFSPEGILALGLTDTGDGIYFFLEDGSYATGWKTAGENTYYFLEGGKAATEPTVLDGETFYFSPKGVYVLLVNPWHSLPKGYTVELAAYSDNHAVAAVCLDALRAMLRACSEAGNTAAICSAYRTNDEQTTLFQRKLEYYLDQDYSEEESRLLAGTVVAVPGTSEHQLGLAVDLVDVNNWNLDESQADMPAQKWLMEHSWEYGFILRYPNGTSEITGIIYEPWHYRYVGVEIATEIHELGITLEEYLHAVL